MKYMGSKSRHAKELLPIILKDRQEGQWYVEPFVGGANMIDKVDGNRIGNDFHPFLIAMWSAVSNGWSPPDFITEEEYKEAKQQTNIDALTGFIGFGCSYSGKWFGGFARGNDAKGNPRNYAKESASNIKKQQESLIGVKFTNISYSDMEIPYNSIIYCDSPYKGTTKYATGGFNHDEFWQWCRDKVKEGHKLFVSEYSSPEDFISVWEKKVNNTLTKDTGSKQGVEKLFVHKSQQ